MSTLKEWKAADEIEFAKSLIDEKNKLFQRYELHRIANKIHVEKNNDDVTYEFEGRTIVYHKSSYDDGRYTDANDDLIVASNAYEKSMGYQSRVKLHEYDDRQSNKRITSLTYTSKLNDNSSFNYDYDQTHRMGGPAEVRIKNMKTTSCKYVVRGKTIPKYLYFQNFEKIKYIEGVEKDLYKAFKEFHFTTYLDTLYIKVETKYDELPVKKFNELVDQLVEVSDKNFDPVLRAGHENRVIIELILKPNPRMEMNKTFDKSTDFFGM